MPVRALVDAAAAASSRPFPGHQLMYVDASLHRLSAAAVDQGADAAVISEREIGSGLAGLTDAFARRFAEVFVLATRLDPFHHADTEQQLYDRVPGWLHELTGNDRVECTLKLADQDVTVAVERTVLGVAQGFYRASLQLISQARIPDTSLVLQLSPQLAALPGLVAELARLDDAHIERLETGHAAKSVLLATDELLQSSADGVKLIKHLSWRGPPAEVQLKVRAPVRERTVVDDPPTHVVYRGIVYAVDGRGLLIGREPAAGRRTIVLEGQDGGVSREHCELVLRDGELKLRDLSRFGTFVNEKRVSGETTLKRADVIRIGSPGAELQAVNMEPAGGA